MLLVKGKLKETLENTKLKLKIQLVKEYRNSKAYLRLPFAYANYFLK